MDFQDVYAQELDEIAVRRSRRRPPGDDACAGDSRRAGSQRIIDAIAADIAADSRTAQQAGVPPAYLVGIAISGGGIRSATFALGALQALSEHGVFERADYLSTVSGGGYIGSCLSSMYANGEREFPFRHLSGQRENPPVRHLRNYSNYLMPRGLLDVLHMPGVLLRGILATFIVVLPVLMLGIIALATISGNRIAGALVNGTAAVVDVSIAEGSEGDPSYVFTIRRAMQRVDVEPSDPPIGTRKCRDSDDYGWLPATNRIVESFEAVVEQIPCTKGDFLIYGLPEGTRLYKQEEPSDGCQLDDVSRLCVKKDSPDVRQLDDGGWYVARAAATAVRAKIPGSSGEAFTLTIRQRLLAGETAPDDGSAGQDSWQPPSIWAGSFQLTRWLLLAMLVALAIYSLGSWLGGHLPFARTASARRAASAVFPVLLVLLVLTAFAELQPIASYYFTSAWSWLSAAGASTNIDYLVYALIGVSVVAATSIVRPSQPPQQSAGRGKLFLIGMIGPIGLWLLGLLVTHWTLCRPPESIHSLMGLAGIYELPGTIYDALGWLFKLSDLDSMGFVRISADDIVYPVSPSMCFAPSKLGLPLPPGAYATLCAYVIVAFAAYAYSYFFLDVNYTSLHRYYRDRLSAAYIFRRESPSCGAAVVANDSEALDTLGANECTGPYHLVNAALNVSGGASTEQTSESGGGERQGQRVDHFLFSMLHVGSDITGYCDSREMRRADPHVNLATAMAISGAAASPRMGEFTVSTFAVLMVLLNVRLGYWIPNPGRVERGTMPWLRRHPGPRYVLAEMLGRMAPHRPFVNVSDGGHIENLGLFALLRRRCRLIVSIDGERDSATGDHSFAGLATAIRMARIDLGVEVDIDVEGIGGLGQPHFAVGRIRYGKDRPDGWLVYLKLSYSGDENPYVREYRKRDPQFPHQSTGDQFFDAAQFEAYRALGQHVAESFLSARPDALGDSAQLAPLRGPSREGA